MNLLVLLGGLVGFALGALLLGIPKALDLYDRGYEAGFEAGYRQARLNWRRTHPMTNEELMSREMLHGFGSQPTNSSIHLNRDPGDETDAER